MAKKHSKTSFQSSWLDESDCNAFLIRDWCRPCDNPYSFVCILCNASKELSYEKGGFDSIRQHAKTEKHKKIVAAAAKDSKQACFTWKQTSLAFSSKLLGAKGSSTTITDGNKSTTCDIVLNQRDCERKAEAIWAMTVASQNYSFASCATMASTFQAMFPDSTVAKGFCMGSSKVSYIIGHGLGPYFLEQLLEDVQGKFFTLHFDETTTVQVKKQMDILIRYHSSTSASVQVRFLQAMMFGHAFADTVSEKLLELLVNLKLPVSKLLGISIDGPNVNKSIKKKLDLAVTNAGAKGLVDIGFCNLHVVNNAFRKGLEVYGDEVESLCLDIFYHFKKSSARREDYNEVQCKLGLDENNFIRHVQSRWLTLLPSVERVLDHLEGLRTFFKYLSHKDGPKVNGIKAKLQSEEVEVQMLFLTETKPFFDEFLKVFQSSIPSMTLCYS